MKTGQPKSGPRTCRHFLVTAALAALVLIGACKSEDPEPVTPGSGSQTATYYTNPGDSRAAAGVVDGQLVTYFGPKNEAGDLLYISHATVDARDNDPTKQLSYDFAPSGELSRARIATGETMGFSWPSPDRVIITYRSADGQQEARFPYDFNAPPPVAPSSRPTRASLSPAEKDSILRRGQKHSENIGRAASAQTNSSSATGEVEVRCGDGALVSESTVTGELLTSPQTGTDVRSPVQFTETGLQGLWEYSLPIAPAPNPSEAYHRGKVERALNFLCALNTTTKILAAGTAEAICLSLALVPAIGAVGTVACTVMVASLGAICLFRTVTKVGGAAVDLFSTEYFVTAVAKHSKLGTKDIRFQVRSGQPIPRQIIPFTGVAGISSLTTQPFDPPPQTPYTITAVTDCAAEGYTLTLSVRGDDNYRDSTPPVALSKTVREATLAVPGATQGVKDEFTAELKGPTTDTKNSSITF